MASGKCHYQGLMNIKPIYMSNDKLLAILLHNTTVINASTLIDKISSEKPENEASAMNILKVEYLISRSV
jgi:hypothetical protein